MGVHQGQQVQMCPHSSPLTHPGPAVYCRVYTFFVSFFFFSSTGIKSLKIAMLPISAGNVKPG